jgi:hypothetical protein
MVAMSGFFINGVGPQGGYGTSAVAPLYAGLIAARLSVVASLIKRLARAVGQPSSAMPLVVSWGRALRGFNALSEAKFRRMLVRHFALVMIDESQTDLALRGSLRDPCPGDCCLGLGVMEITAKAHMVR